MDKRRIRIAAAGIAALALFAIVSPHNRADIRILTHDKSDHDPVTMRAAVDLGLVAVSIVVTWTAGLSR